MSGAGSHRASLVSRRADAMPASSTVAIADEASKLRRDGVSVVDLSAGRAAEATAAQICWAARRAIDSGDTHQTEARGRPYYLEACAEKLQRENGVLVDPARNVIATFGCKQGLVLALMAALDSGDEVLCEDPCFVSYGPAIRLAGGTPRRVPLRPATGYRWIRDDFEGAIGPRTRAILFCSPHNPTGVVHTASDLQVIADVATDHDLIVIADETYEGVTWKQRVHHPIALLPGMADRTIGLMSLTKAYSMGGWRIGYAYGSARHIAAMEKIQQHLATCTSSFVQAGAAVAVSAETTRAMEPTWRDWERRCEYTTSALDAMTGLRVSMPDAGFYAWVDITETGLRSQEFATRLLREQHVAVVPGVAFGDTADHYIRTTCVRSWQELVAGVERIELFLRSV
ncbi:MAG: aminotransferase class I/II-fold pyridoxal phosphate-dependent enzyme [Proteobacteria bacterium]|nr:aminotransferase class I/II-fold pyridoxal phosphate-dependent enzyme [Pseudomonadota bacterium]